MNKFLLSLTLIFIGLSSSAQQVQFGFTGGYTNVDVKIKDGVNDGVTTSAGDSGFYVGAVADIAISDVFHLQPEVVYANAGESDLLYIPVLAKINIAASGFHLLGGPQATFLLEDLDGSGVNAFGLDLSFGAGYDINEHFFIDARYSFEVTNRIQDDVPNINNASARVNSLNIGVGYKF